MYKKLFLFLTLLISCNLHAMKHDHYHFEDLNPRVVKIFGCNPKHEGKKVNSVSGSPDGRYIASSCFTRCSPLMAKRYQCSKDCGVYFWDAKHLQKEPLHFVRHDDSVNAVTFSPIGRILASCSDDGTIGLWDTNLLDKDPLFKRLIDHPELKTRVTAITFSPDGQFLAFSSDDKSKEPGNPTFKGSLKIWCLRSNSFFELKGHNCWVTALDFSPDGKTLVSGDINGNIIVWYLIRKGFPYKKFEAHDDKVLSLDFAPHGRTLISSSEDKTIRFWSTSNWEEKIKKENKTSPWIVTYSPDGKIIASSSSNSPIITLKNANNPHEKIELTGHKGWVTALCFPPDNQFLVSASVDNTIRIWKLYPTAEDIEAKEDYEEIMEDDKVSSGSFVTEYELDLEEFKNQCNNFSSFLLRKHEQRKNIRVEAILRSREERIRSVLEQFVQIEETETERNEKINSLWKQFVKMDEKAEKEEIIKNLWEELYKIYKKLKNRKKRNAIEKYLKECSQQEESEEEEEEEEEEGESDFYQSDDDASDEEESDSDQGDNDASDEYSSDEDEDSSNDDEELAQKMSKLSIFQENETNE